MLKLPRISGVIRRRILVNYRVDPDIVQRVLPACFRPKLHAGFAVAGICLIRPERIRPKSMPQFFGISSENAAHRIAVRWEDAGITREGVFIPRRDTDSTLNHFFGRRVFPGEHHKSRFEVAESEDYISLSMKSCDGAVAVSLSGQPCDQFPGTSVFESLCASSAFFQAGSYGYSITSDPRRLDGLELRINQWRVQPLELAQVYSSYFDDVLNFPPGSAQFDHALIMRNVAHEWLRMPDLAL